jgi:Transposase IS66 family
MTSSHGTDRVTARNDLCNTPDRKAERPIAHLEGFKGILQVDGYAGYHKLAEGGDVKLAFCWAHMRRNFYELATPGPAPIASEALRHIAEFYAIEKDIRGRSAVGLLVGNLVQVGHGLGAQPDAAAVETYVKQAESAHHAAGVTNLNAMSWM